MAKRPLILCVQGRRQHAPGKFMEFWVDARFGELVRHAIVEPERDERVVVEGPMAHFCIAAEVAKLHIVRASDDPALAGVGGCNGPFP